MAKKRQRQLTENAVHKKSTLSGLVDDSKPENDPDMLDSWVIVKKQRVNILLPGLQVANEAPPPSPKPSQPQLVVRDTVESGSPLLGVDTHLKKTLFHEKKKIEPVVHKKVAKLPRKGSPPADEYVPTYSQSMKLAVRTNSRKPDQMATSQYQRTVGVSMTSKSLMQQRRLRHVFLDQGTTLNQGLRARNLERKLQNAGGLSRWLASLGLEQFVRIFQRKGFSKFQLVNLNMKKLKDMGANAVGPRRKLMHAIDCFCQPACH